MIVCREPGVAQRWFGLMGKTEGIGCCTRTGRLFFTNNKKTKLLIRNFRWYSQDFYLMEDFLYVGRELSNILKTNTMDPRLKFWVRGHCVYNWKLKLL